MGGGAWPFLVGGVICLVNSVNERDPRLVNSVGRAYALPFLLLRGTFSGGNNRSVMLNILLKVAHSVSYLRQGVAFHCVLFCNLLWELRPEC